MEMLGFLTAESQERGAMWEQLRMLKARKGESEAL